MNKEELIKSISDEFFLYQGDVLEYSTPEKIWANAPIHFRWQSWYYFLIDYINDELYDERFVEFVSSTHCDGYAYVMQEIVDYDIDNNATCSIATDVRIDLLGNFLEDCGDC